MFGVPTGGQVVLNAHTVADTGFGANARAAISFRSDGLLRGERDNAPGNVDYNGEWWSLEPETGIGSSYEGRHLSTGKTGTYSNEAAAADTWITFNLIREWDVVQTTTGTKFCTATFEVGADGAESADDSAVITVTANKDV